MRIDRYFVGFQLHLEFIGRFSQKSSSVSNFMDIRFGVTGLIDTDGQTDKANLIGGLRDYATASKNVVTSLLPNTCDYLLQSQVYITLSDFTACPSDPSPQKYGPRSFRYVSKNSRQAL